MKRTIPPPRPAGIPLAGRYATLASLQAKAHAADLYKANSASNAISD